MNASKRIAVVLFNLGGPDKVEAVRPFLLNLFTDPAILRVPFFIRPILARIIARARTKPATANYEILGGKSPLLELTQGQADTLTAALHDVLPNAAIRCFIAMRYWHPFSQEAAQQVAAWAPDHVVLLPLYPQYSTTTSGSSLTAWREAAAQAGLACATTTLCCWYEAPPFTEATAALIRTAYEQARATLDPTIKLRLLFSAHGLPEVIVRKGDPYQFQVERSSAAVVAALNIPDLDWSICYQSRATPQQWLEPSTEMAIEKAVEDKVAILIAPIAFVSDHSETLVELDVEYAELAHEKGIAGYFRVPAQNSDAGFITGLAQVVAGAVQAGPGLVRAAGCAACPAQHQDCPHRRAAA
jgi:ferrochelatase